MIDLAQVATGLFGLCTRLFPADFRREYGEELQGVFRCRVREAARKTGISGLLSVCGRELRDLPTTIFRQHLEILQKKVGLLSEAATIGNWRSAREGAIGFGAGMALWILTRWLLDPMNNGMFTHYWVGLFHETVMFSIVGVIGWSMIGHTLHPRSYTWQLARWGAISGGFGGLLATSFVSNSMRLLIAHPNLHLFGYLVQTIGSLIYGACYGLPFIWVSADWKQAYRLVLLSTAFFGIGFWVSEVAFVLYYQLPIPGEWRMRYWGLPISLTSALEGLVAGGLLGWMAGRVKPRLPDPELIQEADHATVIDSGKNRLMNRSMG